MEWRSATEGILVVGVSYLTVSVGVDLVGFRVASWLLIGVFAVVSAGGALVWRDVVYEWWWSNLTELYEFGVIVALLLCLVPLLFVILLAQQRFPHTVGVALLGLGGGWMLVFICDWIGVSARPRRRQAE